MEAQLRRFWPRRKSTKRSTKPELTEIPKVPVTSGFEYSSSYKATVSGPAPQVGSLPLKPSNDKKYKRSFGHSKAQSAGLQQEFRIVTNKDIHSRNQSTGGIQPVLVGISRPVASGSTQRAATTEADNGFVKVPPAAATTQPGTRETQTSQMAPRRHVDIMSFAAANGEHLEAYNEEVAARNLDLKALANTSATTTYVPRSRYQEDAISRNAALMGYRYKASAPMQSVPEGRRPNNRDTKIALNTSESSTPHAYKYEGVAVPSFAKTRSLQDSTAYHSRNGSATLKSSMPLPVIPQEFFVEGAEREVPGLESWKQYEVTQQSERGTPLTRDFTRYPSMHSSSLVGKTDQTESLPSIPKLNTRTNESRSTANGYPKEHSHPLYSNPYETPAADYMIPVNQRLERRYEEASTRQIAGRPSQYRNDSLSRKTDFSSSRTSSTDRGRASFSLHHRADSSNSRTFMDLTVDEPEKPSKQVSLNTDYAESPVLAHATADTIHMRRAQVVDPNSGYDQDVTTPLDMADYDFSSERSLQPPNRQSKRWSRAFSVAGSFQDEQPLAFSIVATVSSTSPASRPITKFSPAAESSRSAESRERSQSSTSRRTPFSETAGPRIVGEDADQRQLTTRSLDSRETAKSPVLRTDTPPKASVEQQNHLAAQTPQMLFTSPESLNSGDFIDPSRSFGVMTRDFASTPSRQSTTLLQPRRQKSHTSVAGEQLRPETPRHKSHSSAPQEMRSTSRRHLGFEQKFNVVPKNISDLPPMSPQLDHVDTPQKEFKASTFDEVEFARKQAQARTALLRLQMSLEEQYDMSPGRPDSSTQRHVARQILGQNRKPRPEEKRTTAAPTSMYYEKKDYQSKAKTNRPAPILTPSEDTAKSSSGYVYEKQGSKSFAQSVYSAVTIAPNTTGPAGNGHAKSSSAGSASHSYNYANANASSSAGASRTPFTLPNTPLTPVLPSPSPSCTEVSLSSFPMPTTIPQSPENRGRSTAVTSPDRPRTARMHSTKSSIASVASVYSIPHHMVPTRDSSRRDQFDEEVVGW